MKRHLCFAMVLGCVLLGAAQVRADVLPAFLTSPEGAPASSPCRTDSGTAPVWMGGGISTQATCMAYCAGGSTLTVGCSGSCQATDMNCPYYNGSVTCLGGGGTTPCASSCPVGDYCEDVNGGACTPNGSTRSCYGSDGLSYTCNCRFGHWICPL